jgi:hypothetical protein
VGRGLKWRDLADRRSTREMHEELLLVEPRGHASGAFARLNAARLRSQAAICTALTLYQRRAGYVCEPGAFVPTSKERVAKDEP